MKYLLTILLFLSLNAQATIYYVSNSGSDAANGTSEATAWATITKVNSVWAAGTFAPGDQILFKRGDIWYNQTLTPTESGTSGNPIIIGAYGAGAKPVISGATTIIAWTDLGGNIYESTSAITADASFNLQVLTINGTMQRRGREPDFTDANKGYVSITTGGSTSFTATSLPNTPINWAGATAAVRTLRYVFDTVQIVTHSAGGTFTLARSLYTTVAVGKGFFITDDPRTLDQHGEWYYNRSTRKVRVYLNTAPSNYTIQAATTASLFTVNAVSYLTIQNIDFQMANGIMADINGVSSGITFDDFGMKNAGYKFMEYGSGSTDLTCTDGYLETALNYGLDLRNSGDRNIVQRTTIREVAPYEGMMTSTGVSSQAIVSNSGNSHNYSYNQILKMGYGGIRANGCNNTRIVSNVIDTFCYVMDDGGAFHTTETGIATRTGNVLDSNIILNGIGAGPGGHPNNTTAIAGGVYLDDYSNGWSVKHNTIAHTLSNGLFFHHTFNIDVQHNTVYNNNTYGVFWQKNVSTTAAQIKNNIFKHNKIIARKRNSDNTQYVFGYSNYDLDNSTAGTLNGIGVIDSNYYARPSVDSNSTSTGRFIRIYMENGTSGVLTANNYTLAEWRALVSHDDHTKQAPMQYVGANLDTCTLFFVNKTSAPVAENISADYVDLEGNEYFGATATVPAYGSLFLMKVPSPPTPPEPVPGAPVFKNGKAVYKGNKKVLK